MRPPTALRSTWTGIVLVPTGHRWRTGAIELERGRGRLDTRGARPVARQAGAPTPTSVRPNGSSGCPILSTYLINTRGLHVSALMRCKFILARKIRDKIDAIRRKERSSVYQARLFAARSQARDLVQDRVCLPRRHVSRRTSPPWALATRANIFSAPMPCRPLAVWTRVRKSSALKPSTTCPR